jgi:hypothetical protein
MAITDKTTIKNLNKNFTLLYMSNSNILKVLCIQHGEVRTKFLREKKKNVPLNTKKNQQQCNKLY